MVEIGIAIQSVPEAAGLARLLRGYAHMRALLRVANINVDHPIVSMQVSHLLAPRLNAVGRLGAGLVATAHTEDDQAETVLHRLLRGTGLHGLSGIPARRTLAPGIELLRPLLHVSRDEVSSFLRELKQPYRVDSSNVRLEFTRNRLRHELMPRLKEQSPQVVSLLCRLAEQAREALPTFYFSILYSLLSYFVNCVNLLIEAHWQEQTDDGGQRHQRGLRHRLRQSNLRLCKHRFRVNQFNDFFDLGNGWLVNKTEDHTLHGLFAEGNDDEMSWANLARQRFGQGIIKYP